MKRIIIVPRIWGDFVRQPGSGRHEVCSKMGKALL